PDALSSGRKKRWIIPCSGVYGYRCATATPRGTACAVGLRAHLLQLLEPFHPGEEVLPGARLAGVLLEIGLGWRFHTPSGDVNVEVALADDTDRFAARTPRLALSYRAITAAPAGSCAALCEALVPIVARNEDAVLAAIERDAAAEDEALRAGRRLREVHVD